MLAGLGKVGVALSPWRLGLGQVVALQRERLFVPFRRWFLTERACQKGWLTHEDRALIYGVDGHRLREG